MDQLLGIAHIRDRVESCEMIIVKHQRRSTSEMRRQCRRFCVLSLGVAAIVLCALRLQAHEIGTTLVSVEFQTSGSYRIEITTDAAALVEKLGPIAGWPSADLGNPAALQALLHKYDDLFRRRFSAEFDGVRVHPSIEYSVSAAADAASSPGALIKLTGTIPDGARHFVWTYSWTFSTYALMVRRAGSPEPVTEWIEGGYPSSAIDILADAPSIDRLRIARTYLALGFTHIVPRGLDHMLFVLGIFLLSRRPKQVLLQVSAFTIAHSITLALSIYGILSVSPAIVEPLIAVSIFYVAIENMMLSELRSWRVVLVFAFGLLHGMGFAGALKELGLPRSEFVTALVTFNAGVEAGQLAVIGAAFLLVGWYCGSRAWYRRRVVLPASAVIAATAIYWTISRLST
jgi:hydrogenase/urease accessory protein HupE